ncbi:Sulfide:quinone oxidoreductase, mitochondrial [Aphelenchoides bicaudatus]|nr:Sulfide:quinone oxidoreductase, mitochondrial [Aphelenchoides bicaudatus]
MRFSNLVLKEHYKLLIAGGSAGGNSVASYFARQMSPENIAVIEPKQKLYYQPGFTLIAGNLFNPESVHSVAEFSPKNNCVTLSNGEQVSYDFLVIATGLQVSYDLIEGLPSAFNSPNVCSIYDFELAKKARDVIQNFNGGDAIFTFPNTPIKCAGAPRKIMYLAEEIFRREFETRHKVIYNTSLNKIFGVEKYATVLEELVKQKEIVIFKRHNLIKVDSNEQKAYFEVLGDDAKPTGKIEEFKYDLLHVAPPCSPIKPLRQLADSGDPLTDSKGWVDVSPVTLQSKAYKNVFGIGDCVNSPNAKTAAAISSQFSTLKVNLKSQVEGKDCTAEYDGYGSCPLVVDSKHCILAEFDYNGPAETLPINQASPSYFSFLLKRYAMAPLYWHLLLKGYWNGPKKIRKLLHLGFGK